MKGICCLVDHESEVVFENVTGTGAPEWVSFHYTVNDPTGKYLFKSRYDGETSHILIFYFSLAAAGEAYIYLNDQAALNISDMNSYAGYHQTVPVQLTLKPGDINTIKFAAVGSSGKTNILMGTLHSQD